MSVTSFLKNKITSPPRAISLAQTVIGFLLRWIPVLIYASWIFVGYRILEEKQLPLTVRFSYLATRDLPANHFLHAEDFTVNSSLPVRDRIWLPKVVELEGKYVVHNIKNKGEVEVSNLRSAPIVVPTSGHIAYVFSLQHQAPLVLLNAGGIVWICGTKCDTTDVRVLSMLCSPTKKDDCSVVLDLPPDKLELFADPAKVQLAVRKPYE
jgi:hypothetical protein